MAVTLRTPLVLATDDDLVRVARDNPGHRFEREEDGTIRVSPTHTRGGAKSLEAAAQLRDYKKRAGGNAFDSNTGFALGPGSCVYAPAAVNRASTHSRRTKRPAFGRSAPTSSSR